jgi:two-component system nitrate/nitrite response regulator NarL
MLNVLLYTTQPVLVLGLAAALEEEGNCHLASVSSSTSLLEALSRDRFDVLLVEATPEIDVKRLEEIQGAAEGVPIVIWVDAVSTEFVTQAVGLGVRGVLRKNLSLELQVRCLNKVAAGELWVEKALIASLLSTKRVVLTPRERQLATLVAQGLKNKDIAYRLGLSEGTVKVYFSRLFQKVGVSDRFELALYVIERLFGGRSIIAESEAPALPVVSASMIPGPLLIQGTGMSRHRPGAL